MANPRYRAAAASAAVVRLRAFVTPGYRWLLGERGKKREPLRLANMKIEVTHEVENFLLMGGCSASTIFPRIDSLKTLP